MRLRGILVLGCCVCALNGYAFEVRYGNFFTITRVRVKQNTLVLPLTRGKYEDVRILDKETFINVKNCAQLAEKEACTIPAEQVRLSAGKAVPVSGGAGCAWWVPVVFNGQWVVQVKAVWEKDYYKTVYPAAFKFITAPGSKTKPKHPTEFEKQVSDFIQHTLKDTTNHEMCARANRGRVG